MEKIDIFYRKKTKRWLGLLTFCLLFFMGQIGFAQQCNISVTISSDGWGDVSTWELLDGDNNVVLSGGPYEEGFEDTQNYTAINPPYSLKIVIDDYMDYCDNVVDYSVSVGGSQDIQGTVNPICSGVQTQTIPLNADLTACIPACPAPTALTAEVTANSATLGWIGTGNFDIKWGASGFNVEAEGTLVTDASNPYNLGGLTTGVSYQFYVRQDCDGDFSDWVGPFSFVPNNFKVIGAGASNTNGTGNDPIDDYYSSMRYQTVYTAAELTAAGFVAYNELTGLGFSVSEGTNTALLNYQIRIGHTTASNAGAHINSPDLITVRNPASYLPTVVGVDEFDMLTFNTHFVWNGVDNIVIDICTGGSNPYSAPYGGVRSHSLTNGSRFVRADTSSSQCSVNTATTNSNRPQIQFSFIEGTPPACPAPAGLFVDDLTTNSAVLGWVSDGDNFDIKWGASGFDVETEGTLEEDFANEATLSGLAQNTTYQFYVRQICGAEESDWVGPVSFTTLCEAISIFPWTENFEGITAPALPDCWNQINANNDGDFWKTWTGGYGVEGSISVGLYTDGNSGNNNDYLVLPQFTLTGNQRFKFSVRARSSSEPNDYRVVLSTTGNSSSDFINEILPLTVVSNTTHQEVDWIDLSAYSGDVYIAIHIPSGGLDGWYIYFDNFAIEENPSCIEPSALTATPTHNSAVLGWTNDGDTFNIKWGVSGFDLETEGTLVEDFANGGTLSDLTPATAYQFYVRQDCGGELSVWAGPFSFSTVCEVPNAPTALVFSNVTATGTTVGYTAPETAPTGYTIFRSTSNIPPVLTNGTAYTTTGLVNSLTVEDRQYFLASSTTSLSASVSSLTANTQYYYYVYSRNCTGATVSYSATPLTGTMTTSSAAPTAFTSNNITFTTADVSWTAPAVGGEAGTYTYFVEVATDSGFTNQIAGSPFNAGVNAVSYNLSGLAQGTFYYVRVRTNNGFAYSPYLTGNITTLLPGQIGTGVSTQSILPIVSNWGYNYSQQIYTKAQVEANLEEGQNFITKIKFYYNGTGSGATPGSSTATTSFENWTVYLGNTDKTSFGSTTDWVVVGEMQQSFSGTVTFPAPSNWMEIILDEPFQWDGDSNIVVAVDENSTSYGSSVYWRSFTSASNTGIYYRNDSTNPDPASPPTASGRVGILAQIAFEAIETPDCMPVTGLAANNTTPYTVDLSWVGTENLFDVIYGAPGFNPEIEGNMVPDITENPYTLSGLAAETTYQVYVRQHCGGSVSPWTGPINFTTEIACPAPTGLTATMVYGTQAAFTWISLGTDFQVEWGPTGFTLGEGEIVNVTGNSFQLNDLTPDVTYQIYVRQNCGVDGFSSNAGPISFTPSYTATWTTGNIPSMYTGTSVNQSVYCTPEPTLTIIVPDGQQIASLMVQYSMTAQNTAYMEEQNTMIYSPTLGAGELELTQGVGSSGGTYNYPARPLSFAVGATGTVEFVLRAWRTWTSGAPNNGCSAHNNFVVNNTWKLIPVFEDIPSCITPTGLLATNPTTNSIDLSWNASTSDSIEGYNWYIFEAGANTEVDTPVASGTTTQLSVTATGLTSATSYDAYVQTDCGAEDGESPLSVAFNFSTKPGCGDMFYDNGGPSGNYTNGANVTDTFFPENDGDAVSVTFNSFVTSGSGDNLKIYDGPNTSAPLLGTFSGSGIANGTTFTSTHPTGALTFVFVSDGFTNSAGWAASISCNLADLCSFGEWLGNTSTAWNTASNWCGGEIPTAATDVIINSGSTNYPVISGDIEVASMTVESGASITVNGSLTTGDITVATGGNFVVANGASLMQTEDAVNTGIISVHRNSNPMFRLDYTLWSSPVTGQNLQAFSPETLPTRIYKYDAATDAYDNAYAETTFQTGQGYLFRSPNNWVINDGTNTAQAYSGVFTGVTNNANIPVTVLSNAFNGLGNPYPSAIDAEELFADNSVLQAIYFWTNSNAPVEGTYVANNWASWTTTGGTSADGSVVEPNGEIAVGQGFIAQVNGGTSVTFNNDMRIAGTGMFFRAMQDERHRYWINLTANGVNSNQILIGYMAGATQDVDNQIDGEMFGYGENALYSHINNSDKQFVIQGRSLPFEATDVVPLGFRATTAGEFTISLANFDGLFAENQNIYLKDNVTLAVHNLKEGAYSFISEEGTFDTRFEVVYQTTMSVETPDLNNNWIVFKQGDQFQILTQGFDMKAVQVFDMLGRTVYNSEAEGTTHTIARIDANQVLIVKVTTADGEVLTKKVQN